MGDRNHDVPLNHDVSFNGPQSLPEGTKGAMTGKIMLSAIIVLFAVVVVMVCLHVYARWYLLRVRRRQFRRRLHRRNHLVFYVEPDNPASTVSVPARGLDASVLKALPTFTFSGSKSDPDDAVLECAVCLSEFEEGEKGRLLPKCNHSFHIDCIDMWFHSHSTCPLCRTMVDGDMLPVKKADDGDVAGVGGDVVVEISERGESAPSPESCLECRNEAGRVNEEVGEQGSSSVAAVNSPSIWTRRKMVELVGVQIEVPRRTESFNKLDELGQISPFKSPTSRILSLKRILSRDKIAPPSPSGIGTSCAAQLGEFDIEQGRVEPQPSRTQTPR